MTLIFTAWIVGDYHHLDSGSQLIFGGKPESTEVRAVLANQSHIAFGSAAL